MTFFDRLGLSVKVVAKTLFFPLVALEFFVVSYVLATWMHEGYSSPTFWGVVGCLVVLVGVPASVIFDDGFYGIGEFDFNKSSVATCLVMPFWPALLVLGCAVAIIFGIGYVVLYLPANWVKWLITGKTFFSSEIKQEPVPLRKS